MVSSEEVCRECPTGAVCPGGESMPIPREGYWTRYDSVAQAHRVFQCHKGTCTGSDNTNLACWTSTNYSKCDSSTLQCDSGASGILCGSCASAFTYDTTREACVRCTSSRILGGVVALVICALVLVCFLTIDTPITEWLHVDRASAKIIWVSATIISTVPSTVEIVFPEPMKTLIYSFGFLEVNPPTTAADAATATATAATAAAAVTDTAADTDADVGTNNDCHIRLTFGPAWERIVTRALTTTWHVRTQPRSSLWP